MNKRFIILWSFILTLSLSLSPAFSQKSPPAKGAKAPAKPPVDRQLTRPATPSSTASPTQPSPVPSSPPAQPSPVPAVSSKPSHKKRIAILDFDNSGVTKEWKAARNPASRSLI